jgi:phenylacetate-CoA ligase
MNLLLWAKNNLRNIPPGIGRYLSMVPYGQRPGIGPNYLQRQKDIELYAKLDSKARQLFIFERIKKVLDFSFNNIPFYQKFYSDKGFLPSKVQHFESLQEIPVMSKTDLNLIELEFRSAIQSDRYLTNTGGSSGAPLNFYIQSSFMGTEWAHIHRIWQHYGFQVSDFKLLFIGIGPTNGKAIAYDFIRNSFLVNIYAPPEQIIYELRRIIGKYPIRFLHGYPSALYSFSLQIETLAPDLRAILSDTIKGVFLNSEFPHTHFRNKIEAIFGARTLSWYGHSERCVLAYEKEEKFLYHPMQTYGHVECLPLDNDKAQLIGTSYYNFASPFIRYNTEDIVENCQFDDSGILHGFKIKDGRSGEFIIDSNGNKISLTGLIFGRHHLLFDYSKYIQVYQIKPGKAIILYVPKGKGQLKEIFNPNNLFDSRDVSIEFKFCLINSPIRTVSGKINLLVTEKLYLENNL